MATPGPAPLTPNPNGTHPDRHAPSPRAPAYPQPRPKIDALARQNYPERRYQPWFGNARRLRALLAELESRTLDVAGQDPRW
jgi:hypothetical protein